jgi:hypothetical protein
MPARQLKIADLLLDLENPRISNASGQKDVLQKIIEDQDTKVIVLAESIVEDGGLNPMDRLLVIKSPDAEGKYIVIEGNRRFAAIKILNSPAVLTGLEVRAPIQSDLRLWQPNSIFPQSSRSIVLKSRIEPKARPGFTCATPEKTRAGGLSIGIASLGGGSSGETQPYRPSTSS